MSFLISDSYEDARMELRTLITAIKIKQSLTLIKYSVFVGLFEKFGLLKNKQKKCPFLNKIFEAQAVQTGNSTLFHMLLENLSPFVVVVVAQQMTANYFSVSCVILSLLETIN